MSKYCRKYGKAFIFEESEKEYLQRKAEQERFTERNNQLFEAKNPPVNFSLHTNDEKVIAAYNKLFNNFSVTRSKHYGGHRES